MEARLFLLKLVRTGLSIAVERAENPDGIDWNSLITEAERQGVSAIASDGLQKLYDAGLFTIEKNNQETRRKKIQWLAKAMQFEQRFSNQLMAARTLGEWLASEGIETVVLKGFTIAECYPTPSHRYSADFDCFLIKGGAHLEAQELGNQVIESHGIPVSRRFYKNSSFHINGLYVENHKFCTPCRGNKSLINLERLLQRLVLDGPLASLGDTGLLKPPPLFSALFLTEHAYSHFLHEGLTLRHILDWSLFRKKHINDVDWVSFASYCAEFGFTRFLTSLDHLGEYVLGNRAFDGLTPVDQRMLDSIWEGPLSHPGLDPHTFRAKIAFVGDTIRSAWKYRAFSNISMLRGLWIQIKGVVFNKRVAL